ncbi:5-formyltetrahydrofolate cyclo-ligase [Patescibacteria group bacterium]|nr:5-formyltetrahydrofolate cyclo-ligase [Patescibacteria group bacterium]
MANKRNIRINNINIRNSLSPAVRSEKSAKIAEQLEALEIFKDAEHVLFYYANETEVNTLPLIEKWSKKKNIYLPKIVKKNEFRALPFEGIKNFKKGAYNIPEPVYDGEDKFEDKLDLIIVPGVAFDTHGNRIGMGKGFYDRYLEHLHKAPKVALAYQEQVLDQLPKDPYDEPVDIIITDKNIYYI